MNDNTAAGAPTAEAGPADDTAPPVPAEIEEAARLAPDHWLGMVDPAWSGEGEPPNWAVVGQWRSGLDGEIEEWRPNEEYRPSPQALGWPAPTDPVDEAVQLAATGYGPGEAVPRTLAVAEVAVLLGPGGVPLSATSPDGASVVPVFTSPTYLHAAGRFGYELTPVPQVVDRIPEGHVLYLNPSGPVGMTVESDALRQAVEAAAREAGDGEKSERPSAPARSSTAGGAEVPKRPVTETSAGARAGGGTGQDPALGLDN
ncbi:type VII secretion system-associated protein [Streptomyces sp. NPDC088400]|uniref:type VII secretion system-associated protein n=1 Tax=Streptomyces sp. NPDC088400 TaxID=3365861 RepID=UPI003800F322